MATSFEIKVKTGEKIVDFSVSGPDGTQASYSGSSTGNLRLSSGFFGGYTLSARMKDGLSSLTFYVRTDKGNTYSLGPVAPFSTKTFNV